MISNSTFIVVMVAIVITAIFAIIGLRVKKKQLIHKLYFSTVTIMFIWLGLVAGLRFVQVGDTETAYVLDALMYIGSFASPLVLLISIVFIKGINKLPRKGLLVFVIPAIMDVLVWTNPLHHLYYEVFSIFRGEVVFGPCMIVNAVYSYACILVSIILVLTFAIKSRNRLHFYQALFFTLGDIVPIVVSLLATFQVVDMSVAATPLSYTATILFHGIAIFYFHMLDLKPIAMQKVLDWISDCYLVISDNSLVVGFNQPFFDIIGKNYGIRENLYLQDCVKEESVENKAVIKNLIVVIDTCKNTGANASYEQVISVKENGAWRQRYYMVEITPLRIEGKTVGFAAIFKDVTKVKESMEKLQASQARMMEQERLASLGHMIGGIAHNLKTPIMSVSGSSSAIRGLIDECVSSVGDPEVTEDDFREIYGEMKSWTERIGEACTYMSDIITAVKGQAANMNSTDDGEFTVSDMVKHVSLLLRHELLQGNCMLEVENELKGEIAIQGDINNMVQVVNNLVSNAIDAMQPQGGKIRLRVTRDADRLILMVQDNGPGVAPEIREKLFKQMITSKGANGTGLGIFISNSVIKAKFGGDIWMKDNPEGGTIFGISISMDYVKFYNLKGDEANEEE